MVGAAHRRDPHTREIFMLTRLFVAAALVPTLILPTTPATGTPAPSTRAPAAPSVWTIDNTHSGVGFQTR